MTLFDILNNPDSCKAISMQIDKKLASPEFWVANEARYLEVQNQIIADHQSIEMTPERYNRRFIFTPYQF